MTQFICEHCGFEMDYDEDVDELIECDECGEIMTGRGDEICDNSDITFKIFNTGDE